MKTVSGFVCGALLAGVIAGCGAAPADPTKGARVVNVVAAENFWGDIARQIGGRHASVTSIISDPSDDPHLYASARATRHGSRGRTSSCQRAGLRRLARKLLGDTSSKRRHVLTVADVLKRRARTRTSGTTSRGCPTSARAIADALAAAGPARRAATSARTWRASSRRWSRCCARLGDDREPPSGRARRVHRARARVPARRRGADGRDAAGLRAGDRGRQRAERGRHAGDERSRSPSTTIDALLYNAQATSPVTQAGAGPAHATGHPGRARHRDDAAGRAELPAWQQHQLKALLAALGG